MFDLTTKAAGWGLLSTTLHVFRKNLSPHEEYGDGMQLINAETLYFPQQKSKLLVEQ